MKLSRRRSLLFPYLCLCVLGITAHAAAQETAEVARNTTDARKAAAFVTRPAYPAQQAASQLGYNPSNLSRVGVQTGQPVPFHCRKPSGGLSRETTILRSRGATFVFRKRSIARFWGSMTRSCEPSRYSRAIPRPAVGRPKISL